MKTDSGGGEGQGILRAGVHEWDQLAGWLWDLDGCVCDMCLWCQPGSPPFYLRPHPPSPQVYPRSPPEFRILVSAFRKPATRLSLTSWDTGTYYSHQCAGLGHTDTSMGVICASVCVPWSCQGWPGGHLPAPEHLLHHLLPPVCLPCPPASLPNLLSCLPTLPTLLSCLPVCLT